MKRAAMTICLALAILLTGCGTFQTDAERAVSSAVTVIVNNREFGQAMGAGFGYDKDLIVTAAHVLGLGTGIVHVRTAGGEWVEAEIVGIDYATDVGLLRARVPELRTSLARKAPHIGSSVYVVGTPWGEEHFLSRGIVSVASVKLMGGRCLLIDAASNPGNSGGPVIDERGDVCGMIIALRGAVPQNSGHNIAYSIRTVKESVQRILAGRGISSPANPATSDSLDAPNLEGVLPPGSNNGGSIPPRRVYDGLGNLIKEE